MTVIGVDDTDSRQRGMCTTYLATRLADRIRRDTGADVRRQLLIRLNPAVEHKTRGNAALALHTDLDAERAFDLATAEIERVAETADPNTHPGLVVAPHAPTAIPADVAAFARTAMCDHRTIDDALALIDEYEYAAAGWKVGRGRIGALAAVGAWTALDDWTYEYITYRDPSRWGTSREVDEASAFAAADAAYPDAWDTVDRVESQAVCVPHTPGPVLYGIRGDDAETVQRVARDIESEPVETAALFVTNQGTDAHLRNGRIGDLRDGHAYRVTGVVATVPETRRGGHVFFDLIDANDATRDPIRCVAFEPTKRFRDRVRALRDGDRITACGEVSVGTLKLEKFAVRELRRTERITPACPECGRSMESAGTDQGYRCRSCGTHRDDKRERSLERELEPGWYEVPPCARRHIAKPLVRGGFDAPVHPER